MSEENQIDFLSLHIDNIIDTYHKLQEYTDEHCICLLDNCRIQNFERFYTLHYFIEPSVTTPTPTPI